MRLSSVAVWVSAGASRSRQPSNSGPPWSAQERGCKQPNELPEIRSICIEAGLLTVESPTRTIRMGLVGAGGSAAGSCSWHKPTATTKVVRNLVIVTVLRETNSSTFPSTPSTSSPVLRSVCRCKSPVVSRRRFNSRKRTQRRGGYKTSTSKIYPFADVMPHHCFRGRWLCPGQDGRGRRTKLFG